MFSNKDLKNLIVPLFLEQLLMALVGIADVFVIGFVGEAAVSGVSLVNSFNAMFINLFITLASGGAVVISQYIGRKEERIDYEEKYKAEPDYVMLVRNVNRLSSCKRCNNLLYQRSTCSCLSWETTHR